jgi:multidrug efflux system membrane fusion protein
MMWSRITAVLLVLAAALWIGSGLFGHHADGPHPPAAGPPSRRPLQGCRAAGAPGMHAKTVTLSGRTEADNRATAVARTTGSIVSLKVRRGSQVNQGDVLAVLSDEAREAQVAEAAAMVRNARPISTQARADQARHYRRQ